MSSHHPTEHHCSCVSISWIVRPKSISTRITSSKVHTRHSPQPFSSALASLLLCPRVSSIRHQALRRSVLRLATMCRRSNLSGFLADILRSSRPVGSQHQHNHHIEDRKLFANPMSSPRYQPSSAEPKKHNPCNRPLTSLMSRVDR